MAKRRSHSVNVKHQVAPEFPAGETLHGLAERHDISCNLIRVRVDEYEADAFAADARAAGPMQAYEVPLAALERLVGKPALELEHLNGAQRHWPRPPSAFMSAITGPAASPSPKAVG